VVTRTKGLGDLGVLGLARGDGREIAHEKWKREGKKM